MGIKADDIEKLFDRYYRVESNQMQQIAGFGIGLYLSAEIVKRHNGAIWVESEIGKGSTFSFKLLIGSVNAHLFSLLESKTICNAHCLLT